MEALWTKLEARQDSNSTNLVKNFDNLPTLDRRNVELLALAAEVSPSLSNRLRSQLTDLKWTCDQVERLGALVAACFEDTEDLSDLGETFWKAASESAFEHNVDTALDVVQRFVRSSTSGRDSITVAANGLLAQRKFKPSAKSLQLADTLIASGANGAGAIDSGKVVDACVYTLVRELSNQHILAGEVLRLIEAFGRSHPYTTFETASEPSSALAHTLTLVAPEAINAYVAEPVLTSIVQGHLTEGPAVQLACALMAKGDFKVRQCHSCALLRRRAKNKRL